MFHSLQHPFEKPKDATYLGCVRKHWQTGTREYYCYSTDNCKEDLEKFERMKQHAREINSRELPIWV